MLRNARRSNRARARICKGGRIPFRNVRAMEWIHYAKTVDSIYRVLNLQQIFANEDWAIKMFACGFNPHFVGYTRVVRRDKVR